MLDDSSPVPLDGEGNGDVFVTCLNVVRKWKADNPSSDLSASKSPAFIYTLPLFGNETKCCDGKEKEANIY